MNIWTDYNNDVLKNMKANLKNINLSLNKQKVFKQER